MTMMIVSEERGDRRGVHDCRQEQLLTCRERFAGPNMARTKEFEVRTDPSVPSNC